jgi:hypothetical protein
MHDGLRCDEIGTTRGCDEHTGTDHILDSGPGRLQRNNEVVDRFGCLRRHVSNARRRAVDV